MVDFELSDEQKAICRMAHDFAVNEIRPIALECDKEGHVPDELIKKAAASGLTAIAIDEEYGGGGLDQITASMVFEELYWGCAGIGTSLGANSLAVTPMVLAGTEEQKKEYFPRLCDPENPQVRRLRPHRAGRRLRRRIHSTTIEDKGDYYLLNGQKCFITNGGIADFYSIFCTFDKSAKYGGIGAVIMERSYDGVSIGKKEDKMGIRASHTAEVFFENVKVPKENLLVPAGQRVRHRHADPRPHPRRRAAARAGVAGPPSRRLSTVRQGARAVRQAHHPEPGHQLHAGRHG